MKTIISYCVASAIFLVTATTVLAQPTGTTWIYFNNLTGLPDDAVYVTMSGATVFNQVTTSTNSTLAQNTSYSLTSLLGTLPGAGGSAPTNSVPLVSAAGFENGFFNIGLGVTGANPALNVVQGRFELFANGSSSANNADISYVNQISLPMNLSIRNRSSGNLTALSQQTSEIVTTVSPAPDSIFTKLTSPGNGVPSDAKVDTGNYTVYNSSNASIGTIGGLAAVLSPSFSPPPSYQSWTATGGIFDSLKDKPLRVASFSNPIMVGGYKPNVTIGYDASGGTSPFGANDLTNVFITSQAYTLNATFKDNLNPGGANAAIATQGVGNGTSGVEIVGSGAITGNFSVFITSAQLGMAGSTWGSDPEYVVYWESPNLAVTTTNTNSLVDRVVGDLFAGINYGWADSQVQVDTYGNSTSTGSAFDGTVFDVASGTLKDKKIGELSTGELFYLLSAQADSDFDNLALWSGERIQMNDALYNPYYSASQGATSAYTQAYSDRLISNNPDIFYTPPSNPEVTVDNIYIQVDLLPGGYTYVVPEPSIVGLLVSAGLVGFFFQFRSRGNRSRITS